MRAPFSSPKAARENEAQLTVIWSSIRNVPTAIGIDEGQSDGLLMLAVEEGVAPHNGGSGCFAAAYWNLGQNCDEFLYR